MSTDVPEPVHVKSWKKLWKGLSEGVNISSILVSEEENLRANVCKNGAKSKFRGHSQNIIFAHVLSIDRYK